MNEGEDFFKALRAHLGSKSFEGIVSQTILHLPFSDWWAVVRTCKLLFELKKDWWRRSYDLCNALSSFSLNKVKFFHLENLLHTGYSECLCLPLLDASSALEAGLWLVSQRIRSPDNISHWAITHGYLDILEHSLFNRNLSNWHFLKSNSRETLDFLWNKMDCKATWSLFPFGDFLDCHQNYRMEWLLDNQTDPFLNLKQCNAEAVLTVYSLFPLDQSILQRLLRIFIPSPYERVFFRCDQISQEIRLQIPFPCCGCGDPTRHALVENKRRRI